MAKIPRRGGISTRSALSVHRGTPNRSAAARREEVRAHLACRVVDRLGPLVQQHTIEGLVMGAAE
ncbi:hypothetical protein [Saccharothrix luteola]|uniref:hypothetical protein n=1 Tax=Saccharothrix luteola TaxID=2893018 RepID=UPI001E530FD9|nr:hypothetical protein [Saccharothrix luteola]MCC8246357.1 hypothetical protein [Saccharothrix luteola]